MHRLRPLLAAAFILSSFGCSKKASYAEASPPMEGAAGGGGSYGPEPTADVSPGAPMADYDRDEEAKPEAPPATAPNTSFGAPAPTKKAPSTSPVDPKLEPANKPTSTATGGQDEEKGKDPQKQFARQIIYIADMAISCFKLDDAMQRAEALTLEAGGYVQTMQQGYFILRIPAPQLRRVMEELGKLGVVESRSLQAQDVTQEYVDLTTRIRVLKETQTQLITLLKQARNVEEALNVRESLDAITMQLEQAMGRLRLLENQIGFSTLTLRLSERGPQNAIPSSNDPFPWVDTLGVEATEWN
jgi:hypothetical protein